MRIPRLRRLSAITALTGIALVLGWLVVQVSRTGHVSAGTRLPALAYRDARGSHVISASGRQPTLIVLFDSRCGHCAYQLSDFDRRFADLVHSRIYLLTTELQPPFEEFGRRWPALANAPSVSWGTVSASDFRAHLRTLVTPALFVFDERGALVAQYVGEIKVDALLPALARRHAS
jgi:hypothetical protein